MKATNTFIACPVCGSKFDIGLTVAMPFCSDRCRQIDLGRWMNEEYGVPGTADLHDEEEEEIDESAKHADEM